MTKIDYQKELKTLYRPSAKTVSVVEVPPMNYLMLDGQGDPNGPLFGELMGVLFPVAYALKFAVKAQTGMDYGVLPAEGLWWVDAAAGVEFDLNDPRRDHWRWTLMVMQPEVVTRELFEVTAAEVARKKNLDVRPLRFERYAEGLAVQILHIGPYAAEGPTLERLHGYMAENGLAWNGKHHEIYLKDPNRTAPEKLQTVIRQPVKKI
jgi:hypothetical protein